MSGVYMHDKGMRSTLVALVLLVFGYVLGAFVLVSLGGCHDEQPAMSADEYRRQQEIKAQASYAGDMFECTAKSATYAASKLCEELVDQKWATAKAMGTHRDAGAEGGVK